MAEYFQRKMYQYITVVIITLFSSAATAKNHQLKIVFAANMNEISSPDKSAFPQLSYLLKKHRNQTTPTFFFFGGGSIGPSMLSSFDRGSHIIDILNQIEPDVMGITKRDFSFTEDELSLRAYEAAFPVVSTNVIVRGTNNYLNGLVPYAITQQGDYKIAVLSTLAIQTIEDYNLKYVSILDKITTIKQQIQQIRKLEDVDLIVLLNTGIKHSLLPLLEDNSIDLIIQEDIDIKSKAEQPLPKHEKYVLLEQQDQITLITINWNDEKTKSFTVNTELFPFSELDQDQHIKLMVKNYESRLDNLLGEIIGVTETSLNTQRQAVRKKENAFANILADSLKKYTSADIGFINGGTIRGETNYPANHKITRRDIIRELPYRNRIVLLELTGEQIRLALEHGLSGIDNLLGRFLHVSGLKVTFDPKRLTGQRLVSVTHKGEPLNLQKKYKVAMSDFLAKNGDDFTMWLNASELNHKRQQNILISDILINYIQTFSSISPKLEGRIVELSQ